VTRWGVVLLVAFIALGLSPVETRKAVRYVVFLTVVVIAFVSIRDGSL
jgi:hypothetical protein